MKVFAVIFLPVHNELVHGIKEKMHVFVAFRASGIYCEHWTVKNEFERKIIDIFHSSSFVEFVFVFT